MSKDVNQAAQERLGGIISDRAFDRFGEVWAEDVVDHDPAPDQAPGLTGIVDFWRAFTTAFPDLELVPDPVIVTDDHVTAVFTIRGTHTGPFQGTSPPAGRSRCAASRCPASATARSSSAGVRRTSRASPSSWASAASRASRQDRKRREEPP